MLSYLLDADNLPRARLTHAIAEVDMEVRVSSSLASSVDPFYSRKHGRWCSCLVSV